MFKNARIKLTVWYLLIIMLISVSFSTVIYRALTHEFERFERLQRYRIERRFYNESHTMPNIRERFPLPLDPELIKETRNRLGLMLVLINAGILVISGGLGYFLAGRTLEPIKEMVDEQNRFISDSSHELRTPLTSLKTAMEVALRDKKLSLQKSKKLISENIAEVNKLQSLSDQLLRLAQYEKPNGNLKFEKVSLVKIIEEAVRKIAPLAKQKQISIKKDLKEIEINGNKDSLIDLFVILLDNAVKYSASQKIIEIKTEKTDGYVMASVKDQGIGVSEKDLPHIFDRFFRADSARSKNKTDGYGLGLSIAKKIVEAHRGTISAESKLGNGSIFTVRLTSMVST